MPSSFRLSCFLSFVFQFVGIPLLKKTFKYVALETGKIQASGWKNDTSAVVSESSLVCRGIGGRAILRESSPMNVVMIEIAARCAAISKRHAAALRNLPSVNTISVTRAMNPYSSLLPRSPFLLPLDNQGIFSYFFCFGGHHDGYRLGSYCAGWRTPTPHKGNDRTT